MRDALLLILGLAGAAGCGRAHDGAIVTETLLPSGAGIKTQLSLVGAATNWEAVADEDAGTYVHLTDATQKGVTKADAYSLTAPTAPGSRIGTVTIEATVANIASGLGSNTYRPVFYIGGTAYPGPTISNPASTDTVCSYAAAVNPATGLEWTRDDLESLQAGPELHALGNPFLDSDIAVKHFEVRAEITQRRADLIPDVDDLLSAALRALTGDSVLEDADHLTAPGRIAVEPAAAELGDPRLLLTGERWAMQEGLSFRFVLRLRAVAENANEGTAADRARLGRIVRRAAQLVLADGALSDPNYLFQPQAWAAPKTGGPDGPILWDRASKEMRIAFRGVRIG